MKADSIFEKAKMLGLDTGSSINQIENLRTIAKQLGVEDLSEIEEALDSMLQGSNEEIIDNTPELEQVDEIQEPELHHKEEFGEREYKEAQDENGKYNKDYYANRGKELDQQVEDARRERDNNWKEPNKEEPDNISPTNNLNGVNNQRTDNIHHQTSQQTNEETPSYIPKSKWDRARDNINLANAQRESAYNKVNSAKSKIYQATHPGEMLKEKAKSVAADTAQAAGEIAKEAGKKAAAATGKAASHAGKAVGSAAVTGVKAIVAFFASNPIALAILIVLLLVLFAMLLLFNGYYEYEEEGYYEAECNYNQTTVVLNICKSDDVKEMNIKDYVIGMTASYAYGKNYSEETLKALMIILKTNALSIGNYDSYSKKVEIDDCKKSYTDPSTVGGSGTKKIESVYRTIEEELFISTSYEDVITNLSPKNQLLLNQSTLKEIENLSKKMTYDEILDEIYNPKDTGSVDIIDEERDTLFVGDSRISQMVSNGIIGENNSVYGSTGGYNWFNGTTSEGNCQGSAITCINNKKSSNENIIIWLGLNDIYNYEEYYKKYYKLANSSWKDNNIFIVSLGYIDESKYTSVTNKEIQTFNFEMKKSINGSGLNNLNFIDLGYNVTSMSTNTLEDGFSYNSTLLNQIYNKIDSALGSISSASVVKSIYKLSTYCTYYTLTSSSDTYWWPVGSSNETAPNIYGGEPTALTVTSPFGMRLHPVYGTYKMHTGIDIGVTCGSNLIAVKSGTVSATLGSCTGSNNGCGGGYGNYVIVDHGDGVQSFYGHMQSVSVSVGDSVTQGERIGLSGTTGTSTGCHLHFEIRLNGTQVDPLEYISAENPRPVSTFGLIGVNDDVSGASETKAEVCEALLNSGFSKNAVAGILGNIANEGSFRTNNLEDCYQENQCCKINGKNYGFCVHPEIKGFGSDTLYTAGVDSGAYSRSKFVNDWAGYGLIQWTYPTRKAGLYDYAKGQNKSIAALSVQLGYFLQEVKGYPTTWKYLTGSYSAYEIGYNFCVDYEGPAFPCNSRGISAENTLLYVNNGCK